MRNYILIESSSVTQEMKDNSLIYVTSIDNNKTYTVLAYKGNKPSCFNGIESMLENNLHEIMHSEDNDGIWYNKPPE